MPTLMAWPSSVSSKPATRASLPARSPSAWTAPRVISATLSCGTRSNSWWIVAMPNAAVRAVVWILTACCPRPPGCRPAGGTGGGPPANDGPGTEVKRLRGREDPFAHLRRGVLVAGEDARDGGGGELRRPRHIRDRRHRRPSVVLPCVVPTFVLHRRAVREPHDLIDTAGALYKRTALKKDPALSGPNGLSLRVEPLQFGASLAAR